MKMIVALFTFFLSASVAFAAPEAAAESGDKKAAEEKSAAKTDGPAREEKPKEKPGAVTIGARKISYIAQTGTMPILKEDGSARANVFYVYYAATDANGKRLAQNDPGSRPITLCFNGGPGSSAVWLHLGGLGPRRIDFPPEGLSPVTIGKIADNPNSILDATDLVFVDPVGTGVSRAAKGEKAEQFFGVDEDIESVGEFVRLFITREQRWASPKFLCGESYGVLRVSGLVDHLQDAHGMYFEGVMLVSGLLNFQTLNADIGNDLPYILLLPTLTATAHYHSRLSPELQGDLEKAIGDARVFAQGDYALALLKGNTLDATERERIGIELARFTGLTLEQVLDADLRIRSEYFRELLLRDMGQIVGRFDGRVTGQDFDRVRSAPEFDPSLSNIIGAFSASVNAFVRGELAYESDHPYRVLTRLPWRYTSFANRYLSTESRLAEAMKHNPRLRVLVCTAKRDLAVPPDAIRFSVDHLPVPESLRSNISWAEFESGHMMYLYAPDAEKLRRELARFVRGER